MESELLLTHWYISMTRQRVFTRDIHPVIYTTKIRTNDVRIYYNTDFKGMLYRSSLSLTAPTFLPNIYSTQLNISLIICLPALNDKNSPQRLRIQFSNYIILLGLPLPKPPINQGAKIVACLRYHSRKSKWFREVSLNTSVNGYHSKLISYCWSNKEFWLTNVCVSYYIKCNTCFHLINSVP